ncbi:hypothetical protein AgCh_031124 [Apium graveolens]
MVIKNLVSELNWKSELTEDRKLSELKASELISGLKCGVSEYPVWSVKMVIFLEAMDPEYLDRIYDGPHNPTKLSIVVGNEPHRMIPKEKREFTTEDISSLGEDAKDCKINLGCIGSEMSRNQCHQKEQEDNTHTEYEHFDSKSSESLTNTYDRSTKLLNDLSLVDKEYNPEDSNMKFLLALPEKWDLKATTISDSYELADMSLDEIYGMLKTHELEME